jgi:hypothetical protein
MFPQVLHAVAGTGGTAAVQQKARRPAALCPDLFNDFLHLSAVIDLVFHFYTTFENQGAFA